MLRQVNSIMFALLAFQFKDGFKSTKNIPQETLFMLIVIRFFAFFRKIQSTKDDDSD